MRKEVEWSACGLFIIFSVLNGFEANRERKRCREGGEWLGRKVRKLGRKIIFTDKKKVLSVQYIW